LILNRLPPEKQRGKSNTSTSRWYDVAVKETRFSGDAFAAVYQLISLFFIAYVWEVDTGWWHNLAGILTPCGIIAVSITVDNAIHSYFNTRTVQDKVYDRLGFFRDRQRSRTKDKGQVS
jgi:hypothetical protein